MNYKKLLPYVVAFAIFVVVNLLYYSPQFQGESLPQHDMLQYKGMSQDILEHREKYGEDPQWEGNMFGGMPAYLINLKYEGTILKSAARVFYFLGEPAALIFIAMFCFYLMLMCMGINPWLGIIPSLAYGFSTYFFIIIGAGHITKMVTLAFIPLMFGGIYYTFRRNMWVGASITGVAAAVTIGANHPQILYYFLFIFLAFWINELVIAYKGKAMNHFAKCTGLLALAAVLAIGSNAGMLWYVNHHTKETIRGGSELTAKGDEAHSQKGLDLDYATAWSYGKGETFNLLIPNLYGGTSSGGFDSDGEVAQSLTKYNARGIATQLPGYWGDQPITSGPVYIGAVVMLIAVLGLFVLQGRMKWWLLVVSLLAIFLAWGKNMMWFTKLFYYYVPMYNKFRTVSMILVIVEWCVPVLAAVTLQQLWTKQIDRARFLKGLKYSTIITGGVALLFLLFGGTLLSFSGANDALMQLPNDVISAMMSERASMMRADSLRTLVFVLLTATILWLFYNEKVKKTLFVIIMALLVTADMVPVNLRYLGHDKFQAGEANTPKPTSADQMILQDKEPGFRVLNLTVSPFQDATTSYFHRSVGGYHGAKLQRYQDLIEHHLSKMNEGVINMLNTKYLIVPDDKGAPVAQLNPEANGAAWFVDSIIVVPDADAEIETLGTINTRTTAVVDEKFVSQIDGVQLDSSNDTLPDFIKMTEYRVNLQHYEYTSSEKRVAVFSEIYYDKGWTAYLDGVEVPYFRADYVLRAMTLPEGSHTVEFKFKAPNYEQLSIITWISSLILIAGVIVSVILVIILNKKHKENGGGRE